MDPALVKELNAFKKKSIATPVVESKKKQSSSHHAEESSKTGVKRKLPPQLLQQCKKQAQTSSFCYKTTVPLRKKNRFSILASIVDLMRNRHQSKEFTPLTLDDVLDKTKNTDISSKDKEWLAQQALKNNTKLAFRDRDGKYVFKPKYALSNRRSLVKLLEKHEHDGLGGIYLDDIRESLPNADDVIKSVIDRVLYITRPNDKKDVLFNYDPQYDVQVDDEFKKHWRSAAVEGLGESDIERYLTNAGITMMQGLNASQARPDARRKKASKRKKQFKVHNTHLGGTILKDYSEKTSKH